MYGNSSHFFKDTCPETNDDTMPIDRNKSFRILKIDSIEEFSSLGQSWNDLLASSAAYNYFLRWEWLWNWWKVYQRPTDRLCILLVFREDDLIGIAPFYVVEKAWKLVLTIRRLMFLGTQEASVTSEYMDVICRAGEEERVIRAALDYIVEENLCDDCYLLNIEAFSATAQLLQQVARERRFFIESPHAFECPYITLPKEYAEFLKQRSGSLRRNITVAQRKLLRYHDATYRKTRDIFEREKDFDELIRLHQCRWESRNLPGSFSSGKFILFQKLVMNEMLKNGHLDLWFLSVSGRNIAALYNIKFRNKIYYFQSGLDASYDRELSPGLLLHNRAIEEAIREGLGEYDFLLQGKTDAYKKRWTTDYRRVCDLYLVQPGARKLLLSIGKAARSCLGVMSSDR